MEFETELCIQSIMAVMWKQPVMQDIVRRFSKWSVKFETELCSVYRVYGQCRSGMETASHAGHC